MSPLNSIAHPICQGKLIDDFLLFVCVYVFEFAAHSVLLSQCVYR